MRTAAASLYGFEMRRCASDTHLEATASLVALHAHLLAHGRLPETLDALRPAYLEVLPRDHFDGAPLRYDPARRLLWSVGSDLRDAEGVVSDDADRLAELAFPIPAREPVEPAHASSEIASPASRKPRAEGAREAQEP
jgi:hypothetical protein